MAYGDGERVGGVLRQARRTGKQGAHHHADLLLGGVASADDGFLHRGRGVFGNDDVQSVSANYEIDDALLQKLSA